MTRRNIKINQAFVIKLFLTFLVVYLFFITARAFKDSNFFIKRDRITFVFYEQQSSFISLGLADNVHYVGYFDNGIEVIVPGGYGRYKIGALGRLADLEKKPALIQKTFSSTLSTYVDFYFVPKQSPIFFEDKNADTLDYFIPRLSPIDVFFNTRYFTNANIADKLFIFITMFDKKRNDFSLIKTANVKKDEDQRIFMEDRFDKKYQGYFYEKTLRDENKNVKIYYGLYKSAKIISRILEGEGIRVVDLSETKTKETNCLIIENSDEKSKTATFLSRQLDCNWKKGDTDEVDLIILLGERLEGEWE